MDETKMSGLLKDWIMNEKIPVRLLNNKESIKLRKKYITEFIPNNHYLERYLWDKKLTNVLFSEQIENPKKLIKKAKELLSFVKNKNYNSFIMTEPDDDIIIGSYKCTDIFKVLDNLYMDDYYLFDNSFLWTLIITHHDQLILIDKNFSQTKNNH